MDHEDGFISLQTLAVYLTISPRTIARKIASGEIPTLKIAGRRIVRRSALKQWLSEQEKTGAR